MGETTRRLSDFASPPEWIPSEDPISQYNNDCMAEQRAKWRQIKRNRDAGARRLIHFGVLGTRASCQQGIHVLEREQLVWWWDRIIDDKIKTAQDNGAFDNLPWNGKPLTDDGEPAGEDWLGKSPIAASRRPSRPGCNCAKRSTRIVRVCLRPSRNTSNRASGSTRRIRSTRQSSCDLKNATCEHARRDQ